MSGPSASRALEAAREAKYREIRDAELDYRTGKLSRADYEAIDAQLRAEALEILDGLEAPRDGPAEHGREAAGGGSTPGPGPAVRPGLRTRGA